MPDVQAAAAAQFEDEDSSEEEADQQQQQQQQQRQVNSDSDSEDDEPAPAAAAATPVATPAAKKQKKPRKPAAKKVPAGLAALAAAVEGGVSQHVVTVVEGMFGVGLDGGVLDAMLGQALGDGRVDEAKGALDTVGHAIYDLAVQAGYTGPAVGAAAAAGGGKKSKGGQTSSAKKPRQVSTYNVVISAALNALKEASTPYPMSAVASAWRRLPAEQKQPLEALVAQAK